MKLHKCSIEIGFARNTLTVDGYCCPGNKIGYCKKTYYDGTVVNTYTIIHIRSKKIICTVKTVKEARIALELLHDNITDAIWDAVDDSNYDTLKPIIFVLNIIQEKGIKLL